jgi:hypothetical protein
MNQCKIKHEEFLKEIEPYITKYANFWCSIMESYGFTKTDGFVYNHYFDWNGSIYNIYVDPLKSKGVELKGDFVDKTYFCKKFKNDEALKKFLTKNKLGVVA